MPVHVFSSGSFFGHTQVTTKTSDTNCRQSQHRADERSNHTLAPPRSLHAKQKNIIMKTHTLPISRKDPIHFPVLIFNTMKLQRQRTKSTVMQTIHSVNFLICGRKSYTHASDPFDVLQFNTHPLSSTAHENRTNTQRRPYACADDIGAQPINEH